MAGVTKDEVLGAFRQAAKALWQSPWTEAGGQRSAYDRLSSLDDSIGINGLDPGPHPSLKAIEERLEEIAVACHPTKWCDAQGSAIDLLDDLRSGKIPPAPTEAEAEQLRAELADLLDRNGEQAKALDVAKREIAALQDRNGRQYETIKGQDAEVGVLRAEVRRLKDEAATTETANRAYSAAVQAYRKTVAELESQVRDLESRAEHAPDTLARGQAKAWNAVVDTVKAIEPQWCTRPGSGMDAACSVIRELAAARDERDTLKAQNAQLLRAAEDRSTKIGTPAGGRLARMMDFAAECSGAGHGSRIARLEAERDALKAEVERLNGVSRVSLVVHTPDFAALRADAQRIVVGLDEIDRKIEAINAGN